MAQWGDPGVTELLQLTENQVPVPSLAGGSKSVTLQRAGLMRRLRFYATMQVAQSAATGAPGKSPYGPLAAINRLTVKANGQIPLIDMSGLGALIYNEVQNKDGSVLSRPLNIAELNVSDSLKLAQYDAGATGAVTYNANYPFEFQFGLPVSLRGMISELGLWILQNQAIDVSVDTIFNPLYNVAATNDALYSGGAGVVATLGASSALQIERELYNIPNDQKLLPNLGWAHQIIEYTNSFTGSFARYSLPRSGIVLRVIVINQDGSNNLVEYSDVKSLAWIYGANETPILRNGQWPSIEYLLDYNRQPPKGVLVLDFYKWGMEGLKLAKDSEVLANLRLETTFNTTTSGTQRIIVDRLYPVLAAQ